MMFFTEKSQGESGIHLGPQNYVLRGGTSRSLGHEIMPRAIAQY